MIRNLISHLNICDYFKYSIHLSDEDNKLFILSHRSEEIGADLLYELLQVDLSLIDLELKAPFIDECGDLSEGILYTFAKI